MNPLVVHADVGANVGTGHVMRCLAIAQEWRRRGGSVTFALTNVSDAVARRLDVEGAAVAVTATADELRTVLAARRPGWVVLDGYHFGIAEQRAVTEAGARALVVDDNGEVGTYECALVLNPNLYANDAPYRVRSSTTRLLLGPSFALLRTEFTALAPRERGEVASRVLFTFGGADPARLSEVALDAWSALADPSLEGLLLVGGANPRRSAIAEAGAGRPNLRVLYDAPNVPELMQWADVAVAASGGTCFELATLGVPAVVVVTAENQRAVALALVERGAARSLGERPSAEALAGSLRALVADAPARLEMSRKARGLVDGRGAARVVDAMMEVGR